MLTKLTKIFVDGYKNIIDCELELGNLNVLVGPNNSGKSNFLEIFSFVGTVFLGSDDDKRNLFEKGLDLKGQTIVSRLDNYEPKPITVSFVIESLDEVVHEIKYSLSIACSEQANGINGKVGILRESLTVKNKSNTGAAVAIFKRDGNQLQVKKSNGKFSKHKISNSTTSYSAIKILYPQPSDLHELYLTSMLALWRTLGTKVVFLSPHLVRMGLSFDNVPSHTLWRHTSPKILPLIAKIKDDEMRYGQFKSALCSILDIEDISFRAFNLEKDSETDENPLYFFKLKRAGHPSSNVVNFSDGSILIIALIVLMLSESEDSPIICFEEPENSLHPKALKALMSFLSQKSHDIQLLFTTHSPYLLNLVSPQDVTVARVRDDGSTCFERVENMKELKKKLNRGIINFGDLLEAEFLDDNEELF